MKRNGLYFFRYHNYALTMSMYCNSLSFYCKKAPQILRLHQIMTIGTIGIGMRVIQ